MADKNIGERVSDRVDNIIYHTVIPILDDPRVNNSNKEKTEKVEYAQLQLTRQYKKYGKRAFRDIIILFVILFFLYQYYTFNIQIIGIVLNLYGSLFIFFPSLNGRYTIATISSGDNDKEKIRRNVERTVFTNIGFALLAIGFFIQIVMLL